MFFGSVTHFFDSILEQTDFGNRWRFWVRGCLTSLRDLVLINGSPTIEFSIYRGFHQEDPLYPFLFILWGIQTTSNGPYISYLFYVDDAIFVRDLSNDNFTNLSYILRCFQVVSGLKVNFQKSRVFEIGVPDNKVNSCASILGCATASFPFTYLRVPVGANMSLK